MTDELEEILESVSEYSESAMQRLIDAARDPGKSAALVDRLGDLYAQNLLHDFKAIALAIALGEAGVEAAIPLLLNKGMGFDMGIFGDAAVYALRRMALSAGASGAAAAPFDAAMALAKSASAWEGKTDAYELLNAARSARPELRQRITEFLLERAPIEYVHEWSEDWTPALSVCEILVSFGEQRIRPLLEQAIADESPYGDEFQSLLESLDSKESYTSGGSWRMPWPKMCEELNSYLTKGNSDEEFPEDDGKSEVRAAHDELAREFAASAFMAELKGVTPGEVEKDLSHFLNSATDYLGLDARKLNPADLREMLFDVLPRKFSSEMEFFRQLPLTLHAFFRFLEDKGYLKGMNRRQQVFQVVEEAKTRLPMLAADPKNWGMAKSMYMMGKKSGYDMTNPADIAKFTHAYNANLIDRNDPPEPVQQQEPYAPAPMTPIRRESPKVGRNDPCPCGSGKKYKKCCG